MGQAARLRLFDKGVEMPKRYDQCDDTCTVDCGHCKGQGPPSGRAESLPKVLSVGGGNSAISMERALKQIKDLLQVYPTSDDLSFEDRVNASIDDVEVMLIGVGKTDSIEEPVMAKVVENDRNRKQLHQLYRHLEHIRHGDLFMAYYGQLRAQEKTHVEALAETIVYFNLESKDWYQARFAKNPEEMKVT
jgi:hypothetical protein